MSYYWFNREELLKKAKEKYDNGGKEKAAKYYKDNKDVIKQKSNDEYKNLSEKEKEAKGQYSKNRYNKMKEKLSYVIKISYYWFNREKLLKNAWNKYHNKGGKQKAVNQEVVSKDQEISIENLSEKEKNKKKKYQRERYHMNADLNERLKQYQRRYYASKKF